MKKQLLVLLILISPIRGLAAKADSMLLKKSETLQYALKVNEYFMRTYPDVTAKSYVGGKERDSKIWTRGVYYEGLLSFYRKYPQEN